jgi:hypothetical protein
MMREFGSANRMSFWPAASSSDAMEAAWPTPTRATQMELDEIEIDRKYRCGQN